MVATTGLFIPASRKPSARPMLFPMETSVQQMEKGSLIPRIVQPMSPVTTIRDGSIPSSLMALTMA